MRLPKVAQGDGAKSRLLFAVIRIFSGFRAPDVVRTLFYREKFFGAAHRRHTHEVMRGESGWTVTERELIAAFVSHVNACRF
jgi:hypothetical protein